MSRRWALPLGLATLIAVLSLVERPRAGRATHAAEWLQAGNVTVRSVRLGEGDTTLVLLHGYGESLMSWRSIADRLGRRFRVVALDLPGFGVSGKPAGPYTLEAMQDRLSDFLARSTEGPVIVIGHSMGGELAAALAMEEPRVVAAVLISPAGYALAGMIDSIPPTLGGLAGAAAPLLRPVHDPAWLLEPQEQGEYDPVLDPAYHGATRAVLEEFDFAALRARLASLRKPVLVLWGRQDPTIPFEVGEAIAGQLPCGTLVPLEGALHRPHQAQPDLVAREIERYFDRSHACEP